jgi:hypothetical protein
MSEVTDVGFKKMICGDMHHMDKKILSDTGAGFVDLQLVGTDADVSGPVTGPLSSNYAPNQMNPDGTFLICIESDGEVYNVTLFDGSQFTITAVQSSAYLGQWYPAKIRSVNIGTTGDFSVGY